MNKVEPSPALFQNQFNIFISISSSRSFKFGSDSHQPGENVLLNFLGSPSSVSGPMFGGIMDA